MAANVKIVRLITGEELLTEVVCDASGEIEVRNPVRIIVMQHPSVPGQPRVQPSVALAPWAEFTEDKNFFIAKSHVLIIMNPLKDFINQYNSIFGGLVLPDTSKLILPGA